MDGIATVLNATTKRLLTLNLDEDFLQMVTDAVNSIFLTMGVFTEANPTFFDGIVFKHM